MNNLNRLLFLAIITMFLSSRLLSEVDGVENGDKVESEKIAALENPVNVENQPPVTDDGAKELENKVQGEAKLEDKITDGNAEKSDLVKGDEKVETPKSRKIVLFIGLGVLVIGAGVLGAAYFLKRKNASE